MRRTPSGKRRKRYCLSGSERGTERNQIGLAAHACLLENLGQMRFHRCRFDSQCLCRFGPGFAGGELAEARASAGVRSNRAASASTGAGAGEAAGVMKMAATALGVSPERNSPCRRGRTCNTDGAPSVVAAGIPKPRLPIFASSSSACFTATPSATAISIGWAVNLPRSERIPVPMESMARAAALAWTIRRSASVRTMPTASVSNAFSKVETTTDLMSRSRLIATALCK